MSAGHKPDGAETESLLWEQHRALITRGAP